MLADWQEAGWWRTRPEAGGNKTLHIISRSSEVSQSEAGGVKRQVTTDYISHREEKEEKWAGLYMLIELEESGV